MLHYRPMLAVLLVLVGSGAARADLILSFTPDGSPANFTVNQGGTVAVPVYIVERNQAPLTSILSTEGLIGGGVRLNYTTNAGNATVTSAVINPGFNLAFGGFPIINNADGFSAVSAGSTGIFTSGSPPAILVGTFTFQGSMDLGNVTTIGTAKPQGQTFPEFTSRTTFTQLETQSYSNLFYALGVTTVPITYFTTVTVVPEPGSLLLLSVPLVASLRAWRRSKRTVAL